MDEGIVPTGPSSRCLQAAAMAAPGRPVGYRGLGRIIYAKPFALKFITNTNPMLIGVPCERGLIPLPHNNLAEGGRRRDNISYHNSGVAWKKISHIA